MPKKFDSAKYKISDAMPERFAQVIPGLGIIHFSKAHLTENDLKALVSAKSKFVSILKEDHEKPSYKAE